MLADAKKKAVPTSLFISLSNSTLLKAYFCFVLTSRPWPFVSCKKAMSRRTRWIRMPTSSNWPSRCVYACSCVCVSVGNFSFPLTLAWCAFRIPPQSILTHELSICLLVIITKRRFNHSPYVTSSAPQKRQQNGH